MIGRVGRLQGKAERPRRRGRSREAAAAGIQRETGRQRSGREIPVVGRCPARGRKCQRVGHAHRASRQRRLGGDGKWHRRGGHRNAIGPCGSRLRRIGHLQGNRESTGGSRRAGHHAGGTDREATGQRRARSHRPGVRRSPAGRGQGGGCVGGPQGPRGQRTRRDHERSRGDPNDETGGSSTLLRIGSGDLDREVSGGRRRAGYGSGGAHRQATGKRRARG